MKKYGIHDATVIVGTYIKEWVEFDARGVVLSQQSLDGVPAELLQWKYACELDGPDAPNPLTAPCLPFPFNANELAAFMLAGIGAGVASNYGSWENGPDAGMLNSMGVLAREPQKALVDAYAAYRQAERAVGKLDPGLEIRRNQLANEHHQRNLEANTREGVFEPGISRDEAGMRRVRAVESTAAHLLTLSKPVPATFKSCTCSPTR